MAFLAPILFCWTGYQKLWGLLPGWLHSELFPPKAYVPQTKYPQKRYSWYKNTIFRLIWSILGPIWSISNLIQCKTPFLALFGEIFLPFSSLCVHFLPARLPGYYNLLYRVRWGFPTLLQFVLPCTMRFSNLRLVLATEVSATNIVKLYNCATNRATNCATNCATNATCVWFWLRRYVQPTNLNTTIVLPIVLPIVPPTLPALGSGYGGMYNQQT